MILRLSSLFALLLLVTMACQNLVAEIDPAKLPPIARKLVVNGYLSPQDTVLAVSVSSSQTVLGDIVTDSVNTVRDATVRLASEGKTVTLAFDPQKRVYTTDARNLPVLVGKTYTLQVQVAGYEAVSSSCTIPATVAVSRLALDSSQTYVGPDLPLGWQYNVRAVWQDPAGQTNYYRVAGYGECLNWRPRFPEASIDTTGPKVIMRGLIGFGRQDQYISDQNQDGQLLLSVRGDVPLNFDYAYYDSTRQMSYSGSYPFSRPLTLRVSVLQTDENYFNYHRARQQQRQSQNNPFAEPVLMPTNIQGGLGCFGAYNRSTMVMVVR
ncbi:hypothetical protein GCM10028803_57050 [Larkinella knui]|uniref:DUF4249 domain-containing protein n=1 Tax=Larkinella knui TaxID=2025310 RepID=A0A3P1CHU9_9BACT|nr:DUF4249 domain-containing protein [Larkinella knui]RRB12849.1 DUF4249 domain-containing protein [Larkinella knui]